MPRRRKAARPFRLKRRLTDGDLAEMLMWDAADYQQRDIEELQRWWPSQFPNWHLHREQMRALISTGLAPADAQRRIWNAPTEDFHATSA
jgi:hypothetical protein